MAQFRKLFVCLVLVCSPAIALAQTPGPAYLDRAKSLLLEEPERAIELIEAVLALPDLPETVAINAQLLRAAAENQLARQRALQTRITLYQGFYQNMLTPEQSQTDFDRAWHSSLGVQLQKPVYQCWGGQLLLSGQAKFNLYAIDNRQQESNIQFPATGLSFGTVCKQDTWQARLSFDSNVPFNEGITEQALSERVNTLNLGVNGQNWQLSSQTGNGGTWLRYQQTLLRYQANQLSGGVTLQTQGDDFKDYLDSVFGQVSGKANQLSWTTGVRWPYPWNGETGDGGAKRNFWLHGALGWQFHRDYIVHAGTQYNHLVEQQYWISLTWQTR